jgi:hypothetical protein
LFKYYYKVGTQKRIYCIVGDANMGKSSLIRALTCVHQSGITNIKYSSTNKVRTFFVGMTSLQEEKALDIKDAVKLLRDEKCNYNLIALRFDEIGKYKKAEEYLKAFMKKGWVIEGIAMLGRHSFKNNSLNNLITRIPYPFDNTINKNASIIREAWGFY